MVFSYVVFAANPISAVTDFVAQLQILELPDKVCIISFWHLEVSSSFYLLSMKLTSYT
jgi:hypothetical protein